MESSNHWELDGPYGKESFKTQPGLLIVTGKYYSFSAVMGKEKRPLFSEENPIWKDMEMMQKNFGAYLANSGTFTIKDNKFITDPSVALYPNFMESGSQAFLIEINGDVLKLIAKSENNSNNTLTWTWMRLQ